MKNRLTYVAVPYTANPELGMKLSKEYSRKVREMGFVPYSPILGFSSIFDNDTEYEEALACCLDALEHCGQALFVMKDGELSKGQAREYNHALSLGIPCIIENFN